MRPFGSPKKPLELSFPTIEKKAPQLKQIYERESTRKLESSKSTRLLHNLTANPLSKRVTSPLNTSGNTSMRKSPDLASLSPKQKSHMDITKPNIVPRQTHRVGGEFRRFEDEEEAKIAQDFRLRRDESQKVIGIKHKQKEFGSRPAIEEEDDVEREKLMEQLGLYGVRPGQRGTLKYKEMFGQLNGSFNQETKKTLDTQILKVTFPDEGTNNRDTLKSTVVIAESPKGNLNIKNDDFSTGNSETEFEQSFEKPEEKIALSDIWSDTTKPEKSVELRKSTTKSKINLEIYLKIENLLRNAKDAYAMGNPVLDIFGEYIRTVPQKDLESFEKIFRHENEIRTIKSSFVLERLAVLLILYFTEEIKAEKSVEGLISTLLDVVHENCILFGYLVSLKVKDSCMDNVWVERLLDLVENEGNMVTTKEKCFDSINKNNIVLSNTMKNMIVTLQNKEVMYGYNSIVVQSDRIPTKEAYSRMLKSLSLYSSQRKLRNQNPQLKTPNRKQVANKLTGRQDSQKELEISREIKKIQKGEEAIYYLIDRNTSDKKFTLVLDLDETLVHFAEIPGHHNELRVRPYVEYFLTEVSKHYEVVIFTTGVQEYADWVLDNIDKHQTVSHRLYRHHATPDPETLTFIKDLSRLGRDLSKIIIVDNLPENFRLQPDNGIAIKPWYDDHEDNALFELAPLLVEIAKKNVSDVRAALRRFREQMLTNIENGCENPHLNLNLDDC